MKLRPFIICLFASAFFASAACHSDELLDRCAPLLDVFHYFHEPERLDDSVIRRACAEIEAHHPHLPLRVCNLKPEEAHRHNAGLVSRLKAVAARLPTLPRMTRETAVALLAESTAHPVGGLEGSEKHDLSQDKQAGLCFGRSCAVHWIAAEKYQVPDAAVRRGFFLGYFWSPDVGSWRFHSVTLLLGDNREDWWLIDPMLKEPVLPSEWMAHWMKRSRYEEHPPLFFVTGTEQLVPDPRGTLPAMLRNHVMQHFFEALLRFFPHRRPG